MRQRRSVIVGGAIALSIAFILAGCDLLAAAPPSVGPVAPEAAPVVAPVPTVLWREEFENGLDGALGRIETYSGPQGETYTADEYWLRADECNGVILSAVSGAGDCDPALTGLSDAIGQVATGVTAPDDTTAANHAVSAWTIAGDPEAGNVVVTNAQPFTFSIPGPTTDADHASSFRFLGASVDAAETTCDAGVPAELYLEFAYDGAAPVRSVTPIQPCADPRAGDGVIRAARFAAPSTLLVDAGPPAAQHSGVLSLIDLTTSGPGNDLAYDNLSLYDATPAVTASFSPTTAETTATLVITVLNSTELAGKVGWSFTDALPDGLVVVDPDAALGGSCDATKQLGTGAREIVVTDGALASGIPSCTITVEVTPETAPGAAGSASFESCAELFTNQLGVDPTGCGGVTFGTAEVPEVPVEPGPPDTVGIAALASSDFRDGGNTRAGDQVPYRFEVTNGGSGTLEGVSLTNLLVPADQLSYDWSGGTEGQLAAGATVVATGSYQLTQADVDAGVISNIATATATTTDGQTVTDDSDAVQTPIAPAPGISLTKSTSGEPKELLPGSELQFVFRVENTGNVTLSQVQLADQMSGLGPITVAEGSLDAIAPGGTITATAAYPVTQADVDHGTVQNDASVTAVGPSHEEVTAVDGLTVQLRGEIGLDLRVTGRVEESPDRGLGEQIVFSYVAKNTGETQLLNVAIRDSLVGLGPISYGNWPGEPGQLAPGEEIAAEAIYPLGSSDTRESVISVATVDSTTPQGTPVTASGGETVTPTFSDIGLSWLALVLVIVLVIVLIVVTISNRSRKSNNAPSVEDALADRKDTP